MCNIIELKNNILNKSFQFPINYVFKYNDNKFIVNQYINRISEDNGLEIRYIEDDIPQNIDMNAMFMDYSDILFIYEIDALENNIKVDNINLIIITNKIKDKTINYINFPKLEKWQIEEYVKVYLPKLTEDNITRLCNSCNYDIYAINNEMKKISLFPVGAQQDIFNNLELWQVDNNNRIFDIVTDYVKHNVDNIIMDVNLLKNTMPLEPFGFLGLLIKQFENVIKIQLNPSPNPESLGMNYKQFNAIKFNNCNKYDNDKLISIYRLLLDVDRKIKLGELEVSDVYDYITVNIL